MGGKTVFFKSDPAANRPSCSSNGPHVLGGEVSLYQLCSCNSCFSATIRKASSVLDSSSDSDGCRLASGDPMISCGSGVKQFFGPMMYVSVSASGSNDAVVTVLEGIGDGVSETDRCARF